MKRKIDWDNIRKGEYRCHWCRYRHSCSHDEPVLYCMDFILGGCYSCKYYYGKDGKFTEKETDQWFERGCEILCPSGCEKRKRLSRKRKKRLRKRGII